MDEGEDSFWAKRAKKRLGQNFLKDPAALMEIAEAAKVKGAKVLEIGAGHGELTQELSAQVGKKGKVVALEIDVDLFDQLNELANALGNVEAQCTDALEYDFNGFKAIFGNLPYYISTPLVVKILESDCSEAVILVQEGFGKRLAAKAGTTEFSRLSVAVEANCEATIINFVPRTSFDPQPEVDSVVVKLTRLPESKRTHYDSDLIRMAFCHKNKSVSKALEHSRTELKLEKPQVRALFASSLKAYKDQKVRTLSALQWQEFSNEWKKAVKPVAKAKK